MTRADELSHKAERVRRFLTAHGYDAAVFASHAGFAWITGGGRSHVSTVTERGVGAVVVTVDAQYLMADNIERERLEEEETGGLPLSAREFPWWAGSLEAALAALLPGARLAADIPLAGAPAITAAAALELRNPLLPPEIERYVRLGEDVGVALTCTAFHARPGLSEHQLAAMLGRGLMDFGITPAVTLVAADERLLTRRHPVPTERRLERLALLVVGARRHGLNISASRMVHFGPVPAALRERHAACAGVDAAFLAATRPGTALGDIFARGQAAYAAAGWPDEWQRHHQGGPTGYAGRDLKATPGCAARVSMHQAFAWNPSLPGVKSEDTYLTTPAGLQLLSPTPDLPALEAEAGGRSFSRPAILER